MGKPLVIDAELSYEDLFRLCQSAATGVTFTSACAQIGADRAAVIAWLNGGRDSANWTAPKICWAAIDIAAGDAPGGRQFIQHLERDIGYLAI